MKVGFIGLGRMGQAMARRVLDGGHDLVLYNRTPEKTAELAGLGAGVAKSVGDAVRHGGVVLTMLADDAALSEVAHAPGGLIESLPKGGIHVAMGTHQSAAIKKLAEDHAHAGQVLVAAPVLGRPSAVEAGRLGIIAAGPDDAISRVQPLFDSIGRRTFRVGADQSAASLIKVANNFLLACAIQAMGEAFTLVEKSNADREAFRDVLTDGLFACTAYEGYSRMIVDRDFDHVGFTATLALKDIKLALAAGDNARVPLPSANVCRDRLLSAIAHGDGDKDWSVLALEQARASGLL